MLLIGLPFTFTKSVLIASVCALGIFVCKYSKTYRNLIIFTFPFVLLLFVFATHFVVVNKYVFDNQKETLFHALDKTSTQLSIGNNYIIKTSYAFLKEKGWFVFKQNPLVGIGSGNFNKVSFESDKSSYRDGYDPHSSITGSLAEMGIIGFSAFLSIFVLAFQRIVLFLKTDLSLSDRYLLYGFLGIFIFMFCEAIATDVMNFRHFWLIFAFFAAWTRKVSVSII